MAVRDDWQGKGVGSALLAAAYDLADHWLPVTRLELTVYTDNARAIALYEKFGLRARGTAAPLRLARRPLRRCLQHGATSTLTCVSV
jgi:GNAT superfamily N-acetyltransferase